MIGHPSVGMAACTATVPIDDDGHRFSTLTSRRLRDGLSRAGSVAEKSESGAAINLVAAGDPAWHGEF
jgi:hypothetical protein